jgi:hypothetical protein
MDRFSDDREALDFIASQIADQAQRDGVPLSEVERKMLYFSETAWTLPDILEVSDEFDRDYDQGVYEKKISQLIKKAVSDARKQQREKFESWTEAIRRLSKEDRFLLVMYNIPATSRFVEILGNRACWHCPLCESYLDYGESLSRLKPERLSAWR